MTMFTIIAERHGVQVWNRGASPLDALKLAEERIKSGAEKVSVFQRDGTVISPSSLKKMVQDPVKARPSQSEIGVADSSAAISQRSQRTAEGKTIRVGGSATETKAEEPPATPLKQRVRIFKARKTP